MWHPFGATGAPDTCLWCGRKLRQQHVMETERVDGAHHLCRLCGRRLSREERDAGRCHRCGQLGVRDIQVGGVIEIATRRKAKKCGAYGDGFFCGLRCAYRFAVRMAELGKRLVRQDTR